MKRVTFAILCLLSISCFNLLAEQEEEEEVLPYYKPLLHKHTHDGKVLIDDFKYPNHICIYLSNGEKIERTCYNGGYMACYLTPVNSLNSKQKYYRLCRTQTDRLIIKFSFSNDGTYYEGPDYDNNSYEYLWSLRDELKDKGIHIMNYDLVRRKERKWNSSMQISMKAYFYYPVIQNGAFTEEISGNPLHGFSIDPKDIKKIELWHNE